MEIEVLAVIIIGIFLGFFIQTIIGFAGALIALPILLIGIELPDAIAYISIFYVFSSIYLGAKEWKNMDKKIIFKLSLASIIGMGAGIWALSHGKPLFLKKALGVFILIYVICTFYSEKKFKRFSKIEYFFEFLGGFFSGLFSTGGPYMLLLLKTLHPI